MPNDFNEKEQEIQLVELVQEVITCDEALREKYQIGNKFRFVRERLQALMDQLKGDVNASRAEQKNVREIAQDEVLVYVYLYNTLGNVLKSWQNMLSPKVFYEYSVNRPIYTQKSHIESLLRSKSNKLQHAYLTITIKSTDVIEGSHKDNMDNPIFKVKEGTLLFKNLLHFTHNGQDYILNDKGELEKA